MDQTKAVYTGMAVGGLAGFGGAILVHLPLLPLPLLQVHLLQALPLSAERW